MKAGISYLVRISLVLVLVMNVVFAPGVFGVGDFVAYAIGDDWSATTGDDHEFTVNLTYPSGTGEEDLVILAWYGSHSFETDPPDGAIPASLGDNTVYVPHLEGETEVMLLAAAYEAGADPSVDMPIMIGGNFTPLSLDGTGPTVESITIDTEFGGGGGEGGGDWSTPTGDDHEFTLTFTAPEWDETGTFYLLGWYGGTLDGAPDGFMALSEGPGTYTIYIPHQEGETQFMFMVAYYAEGSELGGDFDGLGVSNAVSIEGNGPTEVSIEVDFGGLPTNWGEASGDDHVFEVTVTAPHWSGNGTFYIFAWYGDAVEEGQGPDSGFELDGPGTYTVFVPHDEAETNVIIALVWFDVGSEIGVVVDKSAFSDTYEIAGDGPTSLSLSMTFDYDEDGEKPGNSVCEDDVDEDNYFYRTTDGEYDPDSLTFGYGVGAVDGVVSYGYGYGYGYSNFCHNNPKWQEGSANFGIFFAKSPDDDGESSAGLKLSRLKGEGGRVTIPGELPPIISSENANVKLKLRSGVEIVPSDESWDGDLELFYSNVESKNSLPPSLQERLNYYTAKKIQVDSGAVSIGLDEAAVIEIPFEDFDAASDSVHIVDAEENEYEVLECSEVQYTGELESAEALADPENYSLSDNSDLSSLEHCYVYYDGVVYVATNHFTDFYVAENVAASTPNSGSLSGSYKNKKTNEPVTTETAEWVEEYVQKLQERELLPEGESADVVASSYVTRAELVRIAVSTLKVALPENLNDSPFSDIGVDDPYAKYIAVAKENHIVSGHADGKFRPYQYANRAEILAVLLNASKLVINTEHVSPYHDVIRDSWYSEYVDLAFEYGLIDGYGNGLFGPENFATYAEVSKVLSRLTEKNLL